MTFLSTVVGLWVAAHINYTTPTQCSTSAVDYTSQLRKLLCSDQVDHRNYIGKFIALQQMYCPILSNGRSLRGNTNWVYFHHITNPSC